MDPMTRYKAYLFFTALGRSDEEFAAHTGMDLLDAQSYLRLQRLMRKKGKLPRPIYDGQAICASCKQAKPLSNFHTDTSRQGGISYKCKHCMSKKKVSPLERDPLFVKYTLLCTLDGLEALTLIQDQLQTEIVALKSNLEAQEHNLAVLNYVITQETTDHDHT